MVAWRICRQRFVATAFLGEGSRLASGRWNSLGVPMVYTSLSLSLAVLEVYVHLDPDEEPNDLISIKADIPMDADELEREKALQLSRLHGSWSRGESQELQRIGDAWISSRRSLCLPVPSVIVEEEWNLLINPEHPDTAKIQVLETKPFRFDLRMIRRRV